MQNIDQIVILNGGFGRRVKSLSKRVPKCLIKFASKSFLFLQLQLIKKKGIKNIVICCGYKSNSIIKELKKKYIKKLGLKISVSVERKKLGTGGAIINANKYLHNNFFIIYGDSWLDINYRKIGKKFISSNKKCIMTVIKSSLVKNHKPNIFLKNNEIYNYQKNSNNKNFKYIDYGLIALKKDVLQYFLNKKKFDLNLIIKYLIKYQDIEAYKVKNKFYHIGSLEGIKEIKKMFN
jgi:N-acetyl-alpha-D-muramate 1-phosphate uridylyltransferase